MSIFEMLITKRCFATEEYLLPSVLQTLVFCHSQPEECYLHKIREKSIFEQPMKNSLEIQGHLFLKEVHHG